MNEPTFSKRQKKRTARQGARRLLSQGGWDPAAVSDGSVQRLQANLQTLRSEAAFEDSESCPDCQALRSDDPTALCNRHLAQAMGVFQE